MKSLFLFVAALLAFAFTAKDKLTGRWETKLSVTGNVTGVVFNEDGSFEGYVNKKPFVTGTYTLQDSLITITDNGCNGIQGTYKAVFFSNDDSLRFQAISDDCTERQRGMERTVLGRVK